VGFSACISGSNHNSLSIEENCAVDKLLLAQYRSKSVFKTFDVVDSETIAQLASEVKIRTER
jgi:hypothetical protein